MRGLLYNAQSMQARLRRWWPILKAIFTIAILVAIGRRFALDLEIPQKGLQRSLQELWQSLVRPGWLAAAAALYIVGLGFSAIYWYRLLWELDQRPGLLAAIRAYYVGHFGKYLPGKAWAVFLRAGLVRGARVSFPRAVLTTFYEVLVTMAGGAVLAVVLLAFLAPETAPGMDWHALGQLLTGREPQGGIDRKVLMAMGVLLLLPIGIPILPPVYNWIIARMATRIRQRYGITGPLPHVHLVSMMEGLAVTACGWLFLGGSLLAVLHALMNQGPAFTAGNVALYSAYLALAYVAGFIIFPLPSGLGVREFFLTLFLTPELAQLMGSNEGAAKLAIAVAILLRLVWTAAEVVVVPTLYFLPAALVNDDAAGTATAAGAAEEDKENASQEDAP
jgi:glycosyltransferase 2 family protein